MNWIYGQQLYILCIYSLDSLYLHLLNILIIFLTCSWTVHNSFISSSKSTSANYFIIYVYLILESFIFIIVFMMKSFKFSLFTPFIFNVYWKVLSVHYCIDFLVVVQIFRSSSVCDTVESGRMNSFNFGWKNVTNEGSLACSLMFLKWVFLSSF